MCDSIFKPSSRGVTSVVCLFALLSAVSFANGATFRVSTKEPVIVVAPSQWKIANDKRPTAEFPFETFRIFAADGRNAVCMVSIVARNNEKFAEKDFLRKMLTAQARAV